MSLVVHSSRYVVCHHVFSLTRSEVSPSALLVFGIYPPILLHGFCLTEYEVIGDICVRDSQVWERSQMVGYHHCVSGGSEGNGGEGWSFMSTLGDFVEICRFILYRFIMVVS